MHVLKVKRIFFLIILIISLFNYNNLAAQSFDFPTKNAGISFGNSKNFSGIRFNFRDNEVNQIKGLNFTLWRAINNDNAVVKGISLGIMPEAGYLSGIQIGAGITAHRELKGLSFGILGAGADGDIAGITIGGLGAGTGGSIKGLSIGGLGVGCGGDMTGISIGGLGAGAGGSMKGINIGFLGVGAGNDLVGINIGGLGAGAGHDVKGINFALLGVGAGHNMIGLNIGGIGAGCGNELKGITIGGIGAGAPDIRGITIGGLGVGGVQIKGVAAALGMVRIENNGEFTGLAASACNFIKGRQNGLSIGIFNYAYELKGIQIGLINYVRDNPDYLKVLPIFNANF